MNEIQAIAALCRKRHRKSFCLPRYTPKGWFECDLFERTLSGYFTEYEVKLTPADFKADAAKYRAVRNPGSEWPTTNEKEKKHDLLSACCVRGPSRFFYVVPDCMDLPGGLPAFAGLIVLSRARNGWITARTVTDAPRLHNQHLSETVFDHARSVCYYRMHDLIQRQHGRVA